MGSYLNGIQPYALYEKIVKNQYFVDKSSILEEIIPLIGSANQYICITRPRRFGKTVMANMIAAYLGKAKDSSKIFDKLNVSKAKFYGQHLNKYNIIFISFNELPRECTSYRQYIRRIEKRLMKDLQAAYPECGIDADEAVWDVLDDIYSWTGGERFIFVLDEWDYIFHSNFMTEGDRKEYLSFLRNLLKDKAYVSFAYMTGILPIAKYSSGSELNMFLEFTMVSEEKFSDFFGFTETEVDVLYKKYLTDCEDPGVTREGLRIWYDGYHTCSGERVYNPRSVVASLSNNNLGSYWTSSGPYDEIFYYIEKNVADVREDLAVMISGAAVPAKVQEYAAVSMNLRTKDEIFSAMVVYGFLSYENGRVSIPNKELMGKFSDMVQKEKSLGYVNRLARESGRMLDATLAGDTETMGEILSYVHDTETPLLSYNHEIELTAIVNLAYLSARDIYDIQRENKAGIGYVDFIFYPKFDKNADCLILELKIDDTPDAAIRQIKDKKYALRFHGKLGEESPYTGRILAVGIGYDKVQKLHECKVEVLE